MRRNRWGNLLVAGLAVPATIAAIAGLSPSAAAITSAGTSTAATTSVTGTSYTWVGSSQDSHADNHSWGDQLNWSPNGVPGDGDSASIAPPDPNHCVAHVDGIPTVTLQNFSLSVGDGCGASINGGSITVTAGMTWDSGSINTPMTLAAGSSSTFLPLKLKELAQSMTVSGLLTLAGTTDPAGLRIDAPNQLIISSTGTLASTGTSDISHSSCCVNPAKVVNGGTMSVGDGTLTIHAVELDQNSDLQVAAGAQLVTGAAPLALNDGATYGGTGRWLITNGAQGRFAGKQTLGSGFHLELGNDGQGGDSLSGSGQLLGTGEFDWTGGTLAANLTIGHRVLMHVYGANPGNGRRFLSGLDGSTPVSLTNHGSILVDQQATIATNSRAKLVTASDGVLTLAAGTSMDSGACCVSPDQLINAGRVVVQAGTPAAQLDGVAYVATGGTTTIAGGGELQLTGGPQSALTDTTVTGHGRLTVADPTAVNGTITIGTGTSLRLAERGSLDGTALFSGAGSVDWQGGAMSGAIAVSATGGVVLSGPAQKVMANVGGGSQPSSLAVSSTLAITSGTKAKHDIFNIGSSTVTGAGTTTIGNWVDLDGGTFANTGTMTIDPGQHGKVFSQFNNVIANYGTATLASGLLTATSGYQNLSGTTTLAAHTRLAVPFSSGPVQVLAGTLTGTGRIVGNLTNADGVVDPGSLSGGGRVGTLTVTGTFSQADGGKLQIDLSGTSNDRLAVVGAATVAGTLAAHNNKGYTPSLGDTRVALTSGGLTWNVGCSTTKGSGSSSGHWQPRIGTSKLTLVWKAGSHTTC